MHACPECGSPCLCGAGGRCQHPMTSEPDGCLAAAAAATPASYAGPDDLEPYPDHRRREE